MIGLIHKLIDEHTDIEEKYRIFLDTIRYVRRVENEPSYEEYKRDCEEVKRVFRKQFTDQYFRDWSHLNGMGADMATDILNDYIKEIFLC